MKKKKGRVGSSLDDFLKEDGIYEEVTARAIKLVGRNSEAYCADCLCDGGLRFANPPYDVR